MLRTYLALGAALLSGLAAAQNANPDSLQPTPEVLSLFNQARSLPVKERLPALEKVLAVAEQKKDLFGQAVLFAACGVAATRLSMPAKAFDWEEKSLALCRQLRYRDGIASNLGNLAVLYSGHGQVLKAIDYSEQAQKLDHERGAVDPEATDLSNLGQDYEKLGQLDKAFDYYRTALDLAKRNHTPEVMALIYNNIGQAYQDRGELGKALDNYQSALDLCKVGKVQFGASVTLDNIGGLWNDLGQYSKSLEFYRQALNIRTDIDDQTGLGTTLNNIAITYMSLGQDDKALENFLKSLAMLNSVGSSVEAATVLGNIGTIYDRKSDFPKASDYYHQALEASQRLGIRALEATMCNDIGDAMFAQGQDAESIEQYTKALSILREIQDHPDEARVLANLADTFSKNHPEQAISFYKRSVNTYQSLRKGISSLDKGVQSSYKQKISNVYRKLADLCASEGRIEEAEQVLDLLKDDEYFQFIRTRAGTRAETVDLTPREKEWSEKYEALGEGLTKLGERREEILKINPEARTEDQKAELAALRPKLDEAGKAFQLFLGATQEAFAGANADTERLQDLRGSQALDRVLKKLPNNPAAIYTLLTQDGVRVILSVPNISVPRQAKANISAAELNKKILAFREALTDPRSDPRPLGSELYELLVRPIEKDLQNAHTETLMWSLDSTLRYVPVWALYDKQTSQFLIQKYPSSIFTPRTVDRLTEDAHPWTGAGFGVSKGGTVEGSTFSNLPSVEPELAAVQKILGGPSLLNDRFTLEAFRNALDEGPRVVHLATHFRFRSGDSVGSFLLLGNGQPLSIEQFSGLSDGLLSSVDLLVLSACQTAVGSDNADGSEFESFALVAQLKGAAAVMATLWPVADESTSALMGEFYTLRKGHPEWTKLQALREAQLEMIRGDLKVAGGATRSVETPPVNQASVAPRWPSNLPPYSHPYYWASFVLIGNWK